MKFTHLHVHTHYSLLDGLPTIDKLLDYTKELGMDSVAITDHGVLYGAVEFFKAAKKRGIKPIIGCEVYVALEDMRQMRPNVDNVRYHLILLAKNEIGYKNLVKLVSKAHLEGFYYKPRIDEQLLFAHTEGLICLSACIQGKIPQLIIANRPEDARETIKKYAAAFGEGNFYLELQDHPNVKGQDKVNQALIKFSQELNLPIVATNDAHYLRPEDNRSQDILMMISTGAKINDPERLSMMDDDFSLRTPEVMAKSFAHVPQAIENTQKIAQACNFEFDLGKYKLPHFDIPAGKTKAQHLHDLCLEGLQKRGLSLDNEKISKQLDFELSVIERMGFETYFFIVHDFVNWAHEQGIITNARGSAAGSLVAYLLYITDIDPFDYSLLFERFLNPDRISMPDIDIDFADTRRDEVLKYVSQKYGDDHVAQIITFGTIAARVSIRDVGRVLDYPYAYCDKLAKMIPMFTTLEEALRDVAEFKQIYETDEKAKELIDQAIKLEGVVRHASMHACGVVVSPMPLDEWIPVQRSPSDENAVITQYNMKIVEDLGFLKMDFLGLRNLSVIGETVEMIEKRHGKKIDINNFKFDDPAVYQLLQEGKTTCVFQLESEGMKKYLKQLKPTNMEDVVAMVALYRPGPMQFIPDYIARKHGYQRVEYIHPSLKPVLEKTYGIPIYQEQIMLLSRAFAGFTRGEADTLRKAIGKKMLDLLAAQKEKFIAGAQKNHIDPKLAAEVWEWIMPFASYGFNKSHAASYARIAYITAFLKHYYPAEFMSAELNSESNEVERIAFLVEECKSMGLEVLAPDISESGDDFTVIDDKTIRFGLLAIKNVGAALAEQIVAEREKNGKYSSIVDLLERVESRSLNKKSMEAMIKAGVFDCFEERGKLLGNLEKLLEFARDQQKTKENKQQGLFGAGKLPIKKISLDDCEPISKTQKLSWEKELLGLYISGHILEKYRKLFERRTTPIASIRKDLSDKEINYFTAGFEKRIGEKQKIKIGGTIAKMKKIITKTGKPMIFMELEDLTDRIEVVVFPSLVETMPEIFQENKIMFVTGRTDMRDDVPKIIADDIEEIMEV